MKSFEIFCDKHILIKIFVLIFFIIISEKTTKTPPNPAGFDAAFNDLFASISSPLFRVFSNPFFLSICLCSMLRLEDFCFIKMRGNIYSPSFLAFLPFFPYSISSFSALFAALFLASFLSFPHSPLFRLFIDHFRRAFRHWTNLAWLIVNIMIRF